MTNSIQVFEGSGIETEIAGNPMEPIITREHAELQDSIKDDIDLVINDGGNVYCMPILMRVILRKASYEHLLEIRQQVDLFKEAIEVRNTVKAHRPKWYHYSNTLDETGYPDSVKLAILIGGLLSCLATPVAGIILACSDVVSGFHGGVVIIFSAVVAMANFHILHEHVE